MSNIAISNNQTFIIAEVSANHGGSLGRAIQMIEAAKDAGADAVKFQTYTADTMTIRSTQKYFQVKHPKWGGQTLHDLYRSAYTPWEWFPELKKACDRYGIIFISTPFDRTAVDLLRSINTPIYKIASFELIDLDLIRAVAKTKKPMIISTGMATLSEITEAVHAARDSGCKNLSLLKCVSSYPAEPKDMNLQTIIDLKDRFGCPVGLSDHTLGSTCSIAAVTLGAQIVEKHFILNKRVKTADSFFSATPREFFEMVKGIRVAEQSIGRASYGPTKEEKKSLVFRRSLFAVENIRKGDLFTETNIRSIRPGNGLLPKYRYSILGKRAQKNLRKGTPLKWEHVRAGRN